MGEYTDVASRALNILSTVLLENQQEKKFMVKIITKPKNMQFLPRMALPTKIIGRVRSVRKVVVFNVLSIY